VRSIEEAAEIVRSRSTLEMLASGGHVVGMSDSNSDEECNETSQPPPEHWGTMIGRDCGVNSFATTNASRKESDRRQVPPVSAGSRPKRQARWC